MLLEQPDGHFERNNKTKNIPIEIQEIRDKVLNILRDKQDRTRKDTLVEISAQVAHDIRSPLVALNGLLKDISILPEDLRISIRRAINRINDVANNLLSQYKNSDVLSETKLTSELVVILIENIISEKRAQHIANKIDFVNILCPALCHSRAGFLTKTMALGILF